MRAIKKISKKFTQNIIVKNFSLLNTISSYLSPSNSSTKKYFYIKENSTLQDLKFKEEFFEFFAYNYSHLNEEELFHILKKLLNTYVLISEVKNFRYFIRDFLEIAGGNRDNDGLLRSVGGSIANVGEHSEVLDDGRYYQQHNNYVNAN